MTDETTKPKTTPESTKRFRLTIAALKNVEDATDQQVRSLIGEFETFWRLYVDQRMREVESREPLPFPNTAKMIDAARAGQMRDAQSVIQRGVEPTTTWGSQQGK